MSVLRAEKITKVFPGVVALDSVDIAFEAGQVHCIIGENGSGKSTLIKCITGVHAPERGVVYVNGNPLNTHPNELDNVAYVPQEINLFPELTVAENLFLPFKHSGFRGLINKHELFRAAKPWLERLRLNIRPDALVKDITISAQQLLQIGRALVREDFSILLLDEPTTSLTTNDAEVLFKWIVELKQQGKSIVYISHKLEEIFAIGDTVTVLRNGRKIDENDVSAVDLTWILKRMTGRDIEREEIYRSGRVLEQVVLKVEHLSGEQFTNFSFELRAGEILGFAGLVGSGRSELMQAIFGYLPIYSGHIWFEDKSWKNGDTSFSTKQGVVYLPEERKTQGILPMLSILQNISIGVLDKLKTGLLVSRAKEARLARKVVDEYNIKTPSLEQQIKFLSGGNQQKVIIGRAMSGQPKVIVFDEPTKGIDVGAKVEIYKMMKQLAEEAGIGIILISSEIEEVMKCSNRIITMYQGRKIKEFPGETEKEDLIGAIIGVTEEQERVTENK